jgi:uncharacterized protein YndB with AHSA1/START domain
VYSIRLSVEIKASAGRVWGALCDPDEVVQWDSGVTQALDAPPDYPQPGQHVRWRLRSGLFRLLHDRPVEVVPPRKLRSLLNLGPYEMDEAYSLTETAEGTRLDLDVALRARIPIVASAIERRHAGPETRRGFEESLQGLKRFCEHETP